MTDTPNGRDPLPSWNDGAVKEAILSFVSRTTWVEQPMYTQLRFILDTVTSLAPQHPEWKTTEPVGTLSKALDVTQWQGWHIIDMRRDWKTIFPT